MTVRNMLCVGLALVGCMTPGVRAQMSPPEPTKEHKLLQQDVGVWDAEMKIWMQGPDSDPAVSKGVERVRPLGDLWIISNFEGDVSGQQFTGHSQMGYDPLKKKFVGTWIDTVSPHISTMEGTYDEATQELTMLMTNIDPATNKESKAKTVSKSVDKDTRVFTMFMETPGVGDGWTKMMETNYNRRPQEGREGSTRRQKERRQEIVRNVIHVRGTEYLHLGVAELVSGWPSAESS